MWELLWRDGFFKALHPADESFSHVKDMESAEIPKELIGYIPWYFGMPEQGHENVFLFLEDPKIFGTEFGITTAEQGHPAF